MIKHAFRIGTLLLPLFITLVLTGVWLGMLCTEVCAELHTSTLIAFMLFFILLSSAALHRAYRWMEQLSIDRITGFDTRPTLDVQKFPPNLQYLIYITCTNLDSFALRYGVSIEQQLIEYLARSLSLLTKQLPLQIIRYEDQAFLCLLSDNKPHALSELMLSLGSVARKVQQYPFPLSGSELDFRAILHIGVLPIGEVTDLSSELYPEFAKFPLQMLPPNKTEPSIRIFNKEQYEQYQRDIERQTLIPDVIYKEQISTVFQPILDCTTGETYGYEALTRPTNPAFKHIGQLLSDADSARFYTNLELCLTQRAIDTFKQFNSTTTLFLNFAPQAILSQAYSTMFELGLFHNVPLVLEIVERGEVIPDIVHILRSSSKELQAQIALDDFGTGYSNHLALLNAKPDIIKVSRELLSGIDQDGAKQQIYSNIVVFARNLNTKVLAEGVETKEEFEALLRLGMDYTQGWFVGKPHSELQQASDASKQLCYGWNALNLSSE